jgi:Helix-turn-helix domain
MLVGVLVSRDLWPMRAIPRSDAKRPLSWRCLSGRAAQQQRGPVEAAGRLAVLAADQHVERSAEHHPVHGQGQGPGRLVGYRLSRPLSVGALGGRSAHTATTSTAAVVTQRITRRLHITSGSRGRQPTTSDSGGTVTAAGRSLPAPSGTEAGLLPPVSDRHSAIRSRPQRSERPNDPAACGRGHGQCAMTCRYYGISRQTFYVWKRRYDELGPDGLKDRSRRPKTSPNATHVDVVGHRPFSPVGWWVHLSDGGVSPGRHVAQARCSGRRRRASARPRRDWSVRSLLWSVL